MLTVALKHFPFGAEATLEGQIDETTDFTTLIGGVKGSLRVNTKGVSRINSVGTKHWITYFHGLRSAGVELSFAQCSPAIVEQINIVAPFLCGGTIESIYLPYFCEKCQVEYSLLVTTDDLLESDDVAGGHPCPVCSSVMAFDEIPEEYFSFLRRMRSGG